MNVPGMTVEEIPVNGIASVFTPASDQGQGYAVDDAIDTGE
jgi:hypothetical protein